MADVRPIPSYEALSVWPEVRDYLIPAIERDGNYSDEDVLTRIQMRDMQLWVMPNAAAVTQIHVYPRRKVLVIAYLGGSGMSEWIEELMDTMEEYGRAMGCDCVDTYGRKGWERVGKARGAESVYTVVRKAL